MCAFTIPTSPPSVEHHTLSLIRGDLHYVWQLMLLHRRHASGRDILPRMHTEIRHEDLASTFRRWYLNRSPAFGGNSVLL